MDERYFRWLYNEVASSRVRNPSRTYWNLLRQLYKKEFVWFVPNDDNRLKEGLDLRREFIEDCNIRRVDRDWMELGCSMLEMLIALSRRLAFETDGEPRDCFWELLDNVELKEYNDAENWSEYRVDSVLDAIIFRTYARDGQGGLFPLIHARNDQRNVELWYQLNAYIIERE